MFKRLRKAFAPRPRASEADIEYRTAFHSGIAGVFNPTTGQVEWKEAFQTGIAGVFNPTTGQVEWKEAFKTGISGSGGWSNWPPAGGSPPAGRVARRTG